MRAVVIAYALALIFLLAMFPPLGRSQPATPPEPELHADAFDPPPPSGALLASADDFRGPSQFMAGDVAVLLLLPESTGAIDPSREDWTPEQINAVTTEVQAALDWWEQRLPLAGLQFHLRVQVVPTDYEPTTRPMSEEGLWIGDTLRRLGYTSNSYFDQAYLAADAERDAIDADWGTIIFVPNSTNGNGYLADGRFAYAYINGPFSVITSDAGSYGTHELAGVVAHELGHSFGALDQYPAARVSCDRRSGYLNMPTANSQFGGCGTRLPSIMLDAGGSFDAGFVDPSALDQIGYRDSDNDGLIDPLDTLPVLELQERSLASGTGRPLLRGLTRDVPFPSSLQNDVTLNRIELVEYRVGASPWLPIAPADGAYDSATEAFSVELPLYDGRHTVEVRARNSTGNYSEIVKRDYDITWIGSEPRYGISAPAAVASELTLNIMAPPSTTGLQIAQEASFANTAWEPYQPAVRFLLTGDDGPRVFYVRFRDQFGLSSLPIVVAVVRDTIAPAGSALRSPVEPSSVLLQAQDATTKVTEVEVQVDGRSAGWRPFAERIEAPQASASSTVAVRFRDAAGNSSPFISAPLGYRVALPLVRR